MDIEINDEKTKAARLLTECFMTLADYAPYFPESNEDMVNVLEKVMKATKGSCANLLQSRTEILKFHIERAFVHGLPDITGNSTIEQKLLDFYGSEILNLAGAIGKVYQNATNCQEKDNLDKLLLMFDDYEGEISLFDAMRQIERADFIRKMTYEEVVDNFKQIRSKLANRLPAEELIKFSIADNEKKEKMIAYSMKPLEVEGGQTISAPYIIPVMNLLLDIKEGDVVLDIGSGTMYHGAITSLQIPKGVLYAYEINEKMHSRGLENIEKLKEKGLGKNISSIKGNVFQESIDEKFDAIYCAATLEQNSYAPFLLDKLKENGKLIIPIRTRDQSSEDVILTLFTKIAPDSYAKRSIASVAFVPLVDSEGARY